MYLSFPSCNLSTTAAIKWIKAAIVLHNIYVTSRFGTVEDLYATSDACLRDPAVRPMVRAHLVSRATAIQAGWTEPEDARARIVGGVADCDVLREALIKRYGLDTDETAPEADEPADVGPDGADEYDDQRDGAVRRLDADPQHLQPTTC